MVETPLQRAAAKGFIEEAEKLILTGAKPDIQTRRGRSALHYASENGHEEIVTLLITSGAQVDLPNKWGRTALHYAASKHRVNCLKILIKNGARRKKLRNLQGGKRKKRNKLNKRGQLPNCYHSVLNWDLNVGPISIGLPVS